MSKKELKLIQEAKDYIKKKTIIKKMFDKYNISLNEINYIPVKFENIDVSAKTDHGIIYLNYKLLNDFINNYSYLVHEITHWLQQTTGSKPTKGSNEDNYLDNPFEQEGFQNQINYLKEEYGEDYAEDYANNLLNYHDIPGKEKEEKKEILMAKI